MRRSGCFVFVVFTLLALASGCKKGTSPTNNKDTTIVNDNELTGLTLPEIPVTLISAEDRTNFVLTHFWDGLDFKSDSRALDTAFVEQNFANYLAVVQYGSREAAEEAIEGLVTRASANDSVLRLLEWVAWKYLDEPNSPMRSEEMYVLFLQGYLATNGVPDDVKAKAHDRLERAMMNRPGTLAADFRLLRRDGLSGSLLRTARGDTTLVMFYDPECEHCREITGHLIVATDAGALPYRVLAIDVVGNREAWDRSAGELPEAWEVAYALDDVEGKELYHFPALPSFYLLGRDGEVILKDFSLGL